jgi:quinol monooxygenase YgiN
MAFIQVIDFESDRGDELQRLMDEWRDATEGRRSTISVSTYQDRDRRDHYVTIVEFPSYEQAMENSSLPETQGFSARMAALCKGDPRFVNLDEIRRDKF